MNAQKFVEELIKQTLSKGQLKSLNFDEDFVKRYGSNAQLSRRSDEYLSDELLNLLANYNADKWRLVWLR